MEIGKYYLIKSDTSFRREDNLCGREVRCEKQYKDNFFVVRDSNSQTYFLLDTNRTAVQLIKGGI